MVRRTYGSLIAYQFSCRANNGGPCGTLARAELNRHFLAVTSRLFNSRIHAAENCHPLPSVLDWSAYKGRQWVTVYSMHDAAKALREIQRTLRKWQESVHGGLAMYVRDGDAKDRAEQKQYEQWQEAQRREAAAEALEPTDSPRDSETP